MHTLVFKIYVYICAARMNCLIDDILSRTFVPYIYTICMLRAGKNFIVKSLHENSSLFHQCIMLSIIAGVGHTAVIPTLHSLKRDAGQWFQGFENFQSSF